MTKFTKLKKVTKLMQGLYQKHMHIFRLWRKNVQSFKKISMKLYEKLCSQGTHCLYTEGEKVNNVEKVTKNDLTIISKPYAHPHTMKKTQSFKTIRTKL